MFKDLFLLWELIRYYLKKRVDSIIFGFFGSLILSLIGLVTPYLTKMLIDVVFNNHNSTDLVYLLGLAGVSLIIAMIIVIASNYKTIVALEEAKLAMRRDFYERLQDAPISFISSNGSGSLNYRLFSDTESIHGFFSKLLISSPIDIIFSIVITINMIFWQKGLAFFVIMVLLAQVLIIRTFRRVLIKYSFAQKARAQSLSSFVTERFRNIELIKATHSEQFELENLTNNLKKFMQNDIKLYMINNYASVSVTLVNNVWSLGILWYGGVLVLSGRLTLGTLMGFLIISGMLYPRIASITNTILSFQDVRTSLHRYQEFFNVKPTVLDSFNATDLNILCGEVTLENVRFAYAEEQNDTLSEINASFKPNAITAIVGASGAGKSTLVRLIIRLYDPSDGNVFIDGVNIKNVKLESLRSRIGYAVQGEYLFSGTIWDNITYGCLPATEAQVIAAAKKSGAYEVISQLPEGLLTKVGEGGSNLSAGEAQRISLTRLFLKDYKIIILDEPTSFLDNISESKIQESLLLLKQNCTVIIIAHRLSTAKLADKIIVLDNGRIVETGGHDQLISHEGFYFDLYNSNISGQKKTKPKA